MELDTVNMCSHFRSELFEEDGPVEEPQFGNPFPEQSGLSGLFVVVFEEVDVHI